jgi:WD40 repeat protein
MKIIRHGAGLLAIFAFSLAAESGRAQEEDPLPAGVVMRLGSTHLRHNLHVYPSAMSPDGKLLASRGGDGQFCLWDALTGKRLLALPAKDKEAIAPDAFSHDGTLLAGRGDNGVHLWDVAKRQTRFILAKDAKSGFPPTKTYFGPPVFSPDDKLLVVNPIGQGPIRLFDTTTGKLLREWKRGHSYCAECLFLPDGKTLVFAEPFAILRFLDAESGKELRRLQLKDDHYAVDGLAVSPNGKWLAVNQSGGVARDQKKLPKIFRMLDLASGKELYRLLTTDEYVARVVFAPDGKTLVRTIHSERSRIELIEPATGKILKSVMVFGSGIHGISFRADSKVLATSGNDPVIRVWSFPDLSPLLPPIGHTAKVSSLAYTPDGKLLCSAGEDGKAIIWDMKTGKPRHVWSIPIGWRRQIHVCPDARHFVYSVLQLHSAKTSNNLDAEGSALIYKLQTGKLLHRLEPVRGATALSPDGKIFAAGNKDHDIRLWQVTTGKAMVGCKGQKDDASALAFSPDGLWLASAGSDGTVRVWFAASGQLLRTIEITPAPSRGPWPSTEYAPANLAFTPDGLCLVVNYRYSDKTEIWDLLTGTRVQSQQQGKVRITTQSFLANRRHLLTARLANDNAVP